MNKAKTTIFVASAGTGKTTTCLNRLEECLEKTEPGNIGFVTFTRAAAEEARERTLRRFPGCPEKELKGFSTLHAFCFRRIRNRNMITREDFRLLSREYGLHFTGGPVTSRHVPPEQSGVRTLGDRLIQLDSIMRNMKVSPEKAMEYAPRGKFGAEELDRFSKHYRKFRRDIGKLDYTDQLERFLEAGDIPYLMFLFVDEAQDLSPLQWDVVRALSENADRVFVAGDDKQSIYGFAGASPDALVSMEGEREVLPVSYRLPPPVLRFSESIASRISVRQEYTVRSEKTGGSVEKVRRIRDIDPAPDTGTWFFLVRNRCFVPLFEKLLVRRGYLYTGEGTKTVPEDLVPAVLAWNRLHSGVSVPASEAKKVYRYLRCGTGGVKRGFKRVLESVSDDTMLHRLELREDYGLCSSVRWDEVFNIPDFLKKYLALAFENDSVEENGVRIKILTIHGAKGLEADNVVVLPDMARQSHNSLLKDPDPEHRVFYTAVTRAKTNLFVLAPQTDRSYKL